MFLMSRIIFSLLQNEKAIVPNVFARHTRVNSFRVNPHVDKNYS